MDPTPPHRAPARRAERKILMSLRRTPLTSTFAAATAIAAIGLLAACGASGSPEETAPEAVASEATAAEQTPSDILASTAWETTGATDEDGEAVALEDEDVAMFVGYAYFDADGTFTMYDLADAPKMQGDWTVDDAGTTRHIVAKDDAGAVQFERDSDIVTLTDSEFTYRVFPDPENTADYYDIIHTPTDHAEPAA
ncbi:DUF4822 domain-containing protein [Brachybacterium hainanense]|uniref:DUF4822 domain-containing protein n=1 Tax=Brachybacterium hainanense TaxID=1541174 RepID=A0ABV6R9C1_9MICO